MIKWWRKRRRARVQAQPFPAQWRTIVERNFGLFASLTPAEQDDLINRMKVFLAEKKFEGCIRRTRTTTPI
jgi:Mlc titration factor MtfA (ptsG expression regulator)